MLLVHTMKFSFKGLHWHFQERFSQGLNTMRLSRVVESMVDQVCEDWHVSIKWFHNLTPKQTYLYGIDINN